MKAKGRPIGLGWISAIWIIAVPVVMALITAGVSGLCYNQEQESLPLLDHMESIFLLVLILSVPVGGFIVAATVLRRKNNYVAPNQPSQPIAGKPGSG